MKSAPSIQSQGTGTSLTILPHCPVCATSGSGLEKKCERCGAPYHKDCLEYNGHCAIFGCEKDGGRGEGWWNRRYSFDEVLRYARNGALGVAGTATAVSVFAPIATPLALGALFCYVGYGVAGALSSRVNSLNEGGPSRDIEVIVKKRGC